MALDVNAWMWAAPQSSTVTQMSGLPLVFTTFVSSRTFWMVATSSGLGYFKCIFAENSPRRSAHPDTVAVGFLNPLYSRDSGARSVAIQGVILIQSGVFAWLAARRWLLWDPRNRLDGCWSLPTITYFATVGFPAVKTEIPSQVLNT